MQPAHTSQAKQKQQKLCIGQKDKPKQFKLIILKLTTDCLQMLFFRMKTRNEGF